MELRAPQAALAGLDAAAARWASSATARSTVGRMPTGASRLQHGPGGRVAERAGKGLAMFLELGHRAGLMAVYRFLALARPEDPHAADWLKEALRDAEEQGDRKAQMSSLVSLAWHGFFRDRPAGPTGSR